ncbi:Ig-like domain-containing protein [Brevibacillus dissolubilis]|uniref:Ig-like domain-containing protein n=1 Tax=Brevibacillus dissolubilis TaxID=1844116 RepID=UPI00159BD7E4|nr:Ig-like domain-containing protein [Brevibacillus dissolubilis]
MKKTRKKRLAPTLSLLTATALGLTLLGGGEARAIYTTTTINNQIQPIQPTELTNKTEFRVELGGDSTPELLRWQKKSATGAYQITLTASQGIVETIQAPVFFRPTHSYIADVTGDHTQDLVLVLHEEASGGTVRYLVFQGGPNPRLLYQSDDIIQGQVQVYPGYLSLQYSVYQAGDSNAFPSERIAEIYSGSPWKKQRQEQAPTTRQAQRLEGKAMKNPPYHEIERMIEQVAAEYKIPAVLMKAVAWQESSWRQFDANGNPLISYDNGIGIMQLTNQPSFDQNRLKTDILYNLRAGAQVLLEKRSYTDRGLLPSIGNMGQNEMESWYFTLWAYNGWSMYNNPHNIPNKYRKTATYQDTVLQLTRDYFAQPITRIPKEQIPADSVPSGRTPYVTPQPVHLAGEDVRRRNLQAGDTAQVSTFASSLNVRNAAGLAGRVIDSLQSYENVKVTGGPIERDGFVWYEIKSKDGTGWAAAHYLNALMPERISLMELLRDNPNRLFGAQDVTDPRRAYLQSTTANIRWDETEENGGVNKLLRAQPLHSLWVEWTAANPRTKLPGESDQGFLRGSNLTYGETNVPQYRSIQLAFGTEMDGVGADQFKEQLVLLDSSGNPVSIQAVKSRSNGNIWSISSSQDAWKKGETYTLHYLGLPIVRYTTAAQDTVSTQGFQVYGKTQKNIPLTKRFEIGMTKRMDAKSVTEANVWLEDDTGQKVPATITLSSDKRKISLQAKESLDPGAYYLVKITKGLRSETGVQLQQNWIYPFYTEFP